MRIRQNKRFYSIILIAIGLVVLIAFMDVLGISMWDKAVYYSFFWTWAYVSIGVLALAYFILERDLSETLAIISAFGIMLLTGLADILFYWFQGKPVEATLPWLDKHIIMGLLANLMGYSHVTAQSLYFGVMLGFIVTYYVVKYLHKQKW